MEREEKEIQGFVKRLRPSVRYFYRAAYAITADRSMAEFVLGQALVKAYMKDIAPAGALGFRDSVLTVIRECALAQLKREMPEDEWDGFAADPNRHEVIAETIARESLEVQRMSVLRYGCGMTIREIAALTRTTVDRVQEELNQGRLRVERALAREKKSTRPFDRLAMRAVRQAMNREGGDQIDVDYILHAFETELAGRRRPRRVLRRLAGGFLLAVLGLMFSALLWLLAVLMEM
ncbi:MAG: hypothetical protein IJ048_11545 [Clostridia bacterium]|nr:hypothetical protein [Clostridia bacterium]